MNSPAESLSSILSITALCAYSAFPHKKNYVIIPLIEKDVALGTKLVIK